MDIDSNPETPINSNPATPVEEEMPIAGPVHAMDTVLPDIGLPVTEQTIVTWDIDNWDVLSKDERVHGPEFQFGGFSWRILLFPKGNRREDSFSIFLESLDAAKQEKNSNWHTCIYFGLALQNVKDETIFKSLNAQHRFTPGETDWGFNHLCKLQTLHKAGSEGLTAPLIEDNRVRVLTYMKIINDETGVLWHSFVDYDSKKETGYVGLKNQGATCYMNSLLQSFYFTSDFRRATFQIPTENDDPVKSIPLALQRLFYNLQHSDKAIGTTELTKSFGWDTLDSFMQHDVQEFNRVLQDNLETKMKGTKAEGAISNLFVGKMKSYIKCINVDYESSRIEDFYDIQLIVKGMKTLRDSFVDYVSVETLEGENKYQAEGHGLQDAKKGVIFKKFPPVLHLQLRRFEYDMEKDAMTKINDRHEFPLDIDLTEFLETEEEKSVDSAYSLHGVLVHSGDLQSGHYMAFIRPEKDGFWYKFDDDRVVRVTVKEALEDNYGGIIENGKLTSKHLKKFTNAYMLVYVKTSLIDSVMAPLVDDDIPIHLRERLEREKITAERKRLEAEEMHLYLTVKVISDKEIMMHQGFDLCNFEEGTKNQVNPVGVGLPVSMVPTFKVKKLDTYQSFLEMLSAQYNVPVNMFKLWNMVGRQNKTIRPDTCISFDLDTTMEKVRDKMLRNQSPEMRFYLDILDTGAESPMSKDVNMDATALLFLKYYDPFLQKIEYIGKIAVNRSLKISELAPIMCAKKGLPVETPISIFEEIKPGMVDVMKPNKTLQNSEISDGDIICFQKELTEKEIEALPDKSLQTVLNYFDLLHNRVTVTFKEKPAVNETLMIKKEASTKSIGETKDVELILSKKMSYETVVNKLSETISQPDPMHIRLYSSGTNGLIRAPIKRGPVTLSEMIYSNIAAYQHHFMQNPVIYYEILEVSITELDTKRFVKCTFIDDKMKEFGPFELLVPKSGKIKDLIAILTPKIKLAGTESGLIRIMEVINHKISRVFDEEESIGPVPDHTTLVAEEQPLEELHLNAQKATVLQVCHFNKDPNRLHSIPFRVIVKAGETMQDLKSRLQKRMGMNEKDFGRIKVGIIKNDGKFVVVKDDEVYDSELDKGCMLGLDHVDKKASLSSFERAIKITG